MKNNLGSVLKELILPETTVLYVPFQDGSSYRAGNTVNQLKNWVKPDESGIEKQLIDNHDPEEFFNSEFPWLKFDGVDDLTSYAMTGHTNLNDGDFSFDILFRKKRFNEGMYLMSKYDNSSNRHYILLGSQASSPVNFTFYCEYLNVPEISITSSIPITLDDPVYLCLTVSRGDASDNGQVYVNNVAQSTTTNYCFSNNVEYSDHHRIGSYGIAGGTNNNWGIYRFSKKVVTEAERNLFYSASKKFGYI